MLTVTMHTASDGIVYCSATGHLRPDTIAAAVGLLSAEERFRLDQLVFAEDRRDFAVAHGLLRRALSALGDSAPQKWSFVRDRGGKPALAPHVTRANLAFNLAHTRGLAACVVVNKVNDAQVGIDVERTDIFADVWLVAARCLSCGELEALERVSETRRAERFIEHWVLKEAYVKATGEGLSAPLDEISFAFDETSTIRFEAPHRVQPDRWQFALYAPLPGHRLALAIQRPRRDEGLSVVKLFAHDFGERELQPVRTSPHY
jgi:4'-phosphopantetheinyl transferase